MWTWKPVLSWQFSICNKTFHMFKVNVFLPTAYCQLKITLLQVLLVHLLPEPQERWLLVLQEFQE